MPENAKKPQIRFKGFTDDWEQRKLHEFADKVIEKNIGLQYLETFTNSAEFGIISQKDFFDHSISKIESLEGYYIVKNNNFVYNPRISTTAPVGPINRNKLGRTGVMSPLYTVFEANNVNCTFLEYFFRTNKWHPFMILNGDTGARSDRFSIKDDVFFEMPICKPKIDEQIKIGKYLTKFDDLITLHQRKYFCSNNLIFTITTAWEQRKVTELGKIYIGLVTTMTKHYTTKGTLLIRNSDIKDGRFEFGEDTIYLDEIFAKENVLRMHKVGDVITVHTGDVGTSAVIGKKEENSIGFATIVTRPIPQIIDSNYLSTFLNTNKHKKWAVAISTGDGRSNYNLGDYYKLIVPLPNLQEQKEIAKFITQINNLITLHQRKLEKLQNIKKACLEKMFV